MRTMGDSFEVFVFFPPRKRGQEMGLEVGGLKEAFLGVGE